jgi:hypothetical protein
MSALVFEVRDKNKRMTMSLRVSSKSATVNATASTIAATVRSSKDSDH